MLLSKQSLLTPIETDREISQECLEISLLMESICHWHSQTLPLLGMTVLTVWWLPIGQLPPLRGLWLVNAPAASHRFMSDTLSFLGRKYKIFFLTMLLYIPEVIDSLFCEAFGNLTVKVFVWKLLLGFISSKVSLEVEWKIIFLGRR